MRSPGLVATHTRTFLFADIDGSAAMGRRLGNAYMELLADHHRLVRAVLAAQGGEEIDTRGDEFSAVFASPRACAVAAIQAQRELASRAWPAGETMRARMGIDSGEASPTVTALA